MVLISTPKRDDEVDGPRGRKPAPKSKKPSAPTSPRTPAEDEHWSGGAGPSDAQLRAARLRMDEALASIRANESRRAAAVQQRSGVAPILQGSRKNPDLAGNWVRMQEAANATPYNDTTNPEPGSAISPSDTRRAAKRSKAEAIVADNERTQASQRELAKTSRRATRSTHERIADAWNSSRSTIEKYIDQDRAERAKPRDTEERKLKKEDFSKLSNNQRAAVLFNTELVRAIKRDKLEDDGNDSNVRTFLRDLGLADTVSDVSEYVNLQGAVNDVDLVRLDDKDVKRDSAASKRWESGMMGVTSADRFLDARGIASRAAGAAGDAIASKGQLTLRPNDKVKTLRGMGTTPDDETIRHVYGLMVDKQNDYSSDDIAKGIAALNAANGTTITVDDVWDFAAAQAQAAEYADIRNEGRVRSEEGGIFTNKDGQELLTRKRGAKTKDAPMPDLALLDKNGNAIIARSLADIRKKYGI